MEPQSGSRLTRSLPLPLHGTRSHGMDRLSALSDDMLLLVLGHLGCVRTAVQSSLLSRRWRRLYMGLADLNFRRLTPTMMDAAFQCFAASPHVSTLDIGVTWRHNARSTNSLMRAAVRLSPGRLLFTVQESYAAGYKDIELPCFPGTTLIKLDTRGVCVKPLPDGEFTVLESLSITGRVTDLRSLLSRCPSLRMLSISHREMRISPATLPPAGELTALEKVSLSGKVVDLGPLLHGCNCLQELSITQLDTCLLHIMLPPSGVFPVLEKLSLSGNIADFRTLLSRCPCLRVLDVTFCGMPLGSLEAGLAALEDAAPRGLMLSRLGVEIPWRDDVDTACFNSLFCTVARLSPHQFIFTENYEGCNFSRSDKKVNADLPCFPHATSMSILMRLQTVVSFTTLLAGEFSTLKRLSLSGCDGIVDVGTLVTRCPCLQELYVTVPAVSKISVHSVSLQKLYWSHDVDEPTECHRIDIVTPILKQLHLNVHASSDMDVSISAPAVEKVSWRSTYTTSLALLFGSWRLQIMTVRTTERSRVDNNRDDTCWQQLPWFHYLRLHLNAGNHLDGGLNFAQEIEKLPVTDFSMVELYFKYERHVYGGFVLQFLRIRQICAATKKLKVVVPFCHEKKRGCQNNCPCDNPKNWRSQDIFYTSLEEVEIYGFGGEDHEYDFLRLIFVCSPMLKRLTMKLAEAFGRCTTKLCSILLAHPSVNWCYSHSNSSEVVSSASG